MHLRDRSALLVGLEPAVPIELEDILIIDEELLLAVGVELEDQALSSCPLAENEAVIVDRASVFLLELIDEALRQEWVVEDRVLLQIYISVGVYKLLEPVLRIRRVAGSIEAAARKFNLQAVYIGTASPVNSRESDSV